MWKNRAIEVIRPDVECTNGIIHVIDRPLLEESDIRVTRDGALSIESTPAILIANILLILTARFFV